MNFSISLFNCSAREVCVFVCARWNGVFAWNVNEEKKGNNDLIILTWNIGYLHLRNLDLCGVE